MSRAHSLPFAVAAVVSIAAGNAAARKADVSAGAGAPTEAAAGGGAAAAASLPQPVMTFAATAVPADLKSDLSSDDLDRATDAADKIGALKSAPALEALLDALAMGPSPRIVFEILSALEPYHSPKEVDVVAAYLHNRNSDLRAKAIETLGPIDDPHVGPMLLDALGDQVPAVRAAAATMVAERHEPRAEARLLKLFKRADRGAAVPLGTVATVSSASQLGELLGRVPNDALASCLAAMLGRADFGPEDLRVQVVKLLGKIPGGDATAALAQYVASIPASPPRASRAEAQKILETRQ